MADKSKGTALSGPDAVDGEDISPRSVDTDDATIGRRFPDFSDVYGVGRSQPTGIPLQQPGGFGVQNNPIVVLTANDVTDFSGINFVADVFGIPDADDPELTHAYFEVMNRDASPEETNIGHATFRDPTDWTYDQVIYSTRVSDTSKRNFPYTWRENGSAYQFDHDGNDLNIYDLGDDMVSPSLVVTHNPAENGDPVKVNGISDDRTYVLTHRASSPAEKHLFYTDDLYTSGLTAHPDNPVITDARLGKNGGRPSHHGDWIQLFCRGAHSSLSGSSVQAIAITELGPNAGEFSYSELPNSPVVRPQGEGFGSHSVHHFDPMLGNVGLIDGSKGGTTPETDWQIAVVPLQGRRQAPVDPVASESIELTHPTPGTADITNSNSWAGVGWSNNRYNIDTGGSPAVGETGSIRWRRYEFGMPLEFGRPWSYCVELYYDLNPGGITDYHAMGHPWDGGVGIGFKNETGSLVGVVHDGTTETTTSTVQSIASGTGYTAECFVEPWSGEIRFLVDGVEQASVDLLKANVTGTVTDLSGHHVEAADGNRARLFFMPRVSRKP